MKQRQNSQAAVWSGSRSALLTAQGARVAEEHSRKSQPVPGGRVMWMRSCPLCKSLLIYYAARGMELPPQR